LTGPIASIYGPIMYRYGDAEYGSRFARPDTAWDSNPVFVTFDIGPRNSQSRPVPRSFLVVKNGSKMVDSAEEAIDVFAEWHPALPLLDVNLPDMNGLTWQGR
jgi:hypothetical protein